MEQKQCCSTGKHLQHLIYILNRPNAISSYSDEVLEKAKIIFNNMSPLEKDQLAYNIIVYTQGFINSAVEDEADYKEHF